MKTIIKAFTFVGCLFLFACNTEESTTTTETTTETTMGGQEAVQDEDSEKDIVKVAMASPDHTTLVAAVKQAGLVTSLANAGPFTVFAPTNAAFEKLPKGTVEGLMKNDKKADLENILQYHVTTSSLRTEYFSDGQTLGMVNGDNITISIKDGKIMLNNSATIIGSVQASNGMVHVIDGVLLPPTK